MVEPLQASRAISHDDEIDLLELFRVLWVGKWLIGSITCTVAAIAIIVAVFLPNIYRAEAVLAPNDHQSSGGLSALASQYSGLANLAGLNVNSGTINKTALGLEILKSRKFISDFVQRHELWVPLMAAKGWDPETGELIIDPDKYDVIAEKWEKDGVWSSSSMPSLQEAHRTFTSMLSVGQNNDTALVTVSIEHYSPIVAKQWVDWLVDDLNSTIMHQDVAEAEQAIQYLNKQVESTSLADLQSVFFNLIEEQTKTIMLAKVTDQYLLKTIDPAVAPELKARPKRSLIVIVATVLGSCFGIALVLFLSWMRKEVNEVAK